MSIQQIERDAKHWKSGFVDPAQLECERARFRAGWSFLGFASELPREGDWIARDLWGCPIFVQRCGGELKGFENRCAHRFFPLRRAPKGNGPIRCGFHGWEYDKDGRVVGVPMCKELFGTTPRALDARLQPVEIATCGQLIFGRFASRGSEIDLVDYLGALAPILDAMTADAAAPPAIDSVVAANWKLAYYITLEDYHIVCIHPSTFGAAGPLRDVRYFRCDPHSVMMNDGEIDEGTLDRVAAECAARRYQPEGYKVFHVFPNVAVLHYGYWGRWYVLVMQYLPLSVDRTIVRTWYFAANFASRPGPARRIANACLDPARNLVLRRGIRKIVGEDNAVCEALQRDAAGLSRLPILGAQEERIAWFDEAYARAMAQDQHETRDAAIDFLASRRTRQEA